MKRVNKSKQFKSGKQPDKQRQTNTSERNSYWFFLLRNWQYLSPKQKFLLTVGTVAVVITAGFTLYSVTRLTTNQSKLAEKNVYKQTVSKLHPLVKQNSPSLPWQKPDEVKPFYFKFTDQKGRLVNFIIQVPLKFYRLFELFDGQLSPYERNELILNELQAFSKSEQKEFWRIFWRDAKPVVESIAIASRDLPLNLLKLIYEACHIPRDFTLQDGHTPLHDAESADIIQFLLQDFGVDINIAENHYGSTVLHYAILNENLTRLRILLQQAQKAGVTIDFTKADKLGKTPLIAAIRVNSAPMVAAILAHDKTSSSLNYPQPTTGMTPLHYASLLGNSEIVKLLLKAGAKVNQVDNKGNTALHYLSYNKAKTAHYLSEIWIEPERDANAPTNALKTCLQGRCSRLVIDSERASKLKIATTAFSREQYHQKPLKTLILYTRKNVELVIKYRLYDQQTLRYLRELLPKLRGQSIVDGCLAGRQKVLELLDKHGADLLAKNQAGQQPSELIQLKTNNALLPEYEKAILLQLKQTLERKAAALEQAQAPAPGLS